MGGKQQIHHCKIELVLEVRNIYPDSTRDSKKREGVCVTYLYFFIIFYTFVYEKTSTFDNNVNLDLSIGTREDPAGQIKYKQFLQVYFRMLVLECYHFDFTLLSKFYLIRSVLACSRFQVHVFLCPWFYKRHYHLTVKPVLQRNLIGPKNTNFRESWVNILEILRDILYIV